MNVAERINRILFILSSVVKHQGIRVDDLAHQVGLKPRQLLKELDFMMLIGKPPFRPDDYVDIYVEGDQVFVEFDQMLNRPLRFTRPEAMALLMSLQLLDPQVDPEAVESLRAKIKRAISESVDSSASLQDRIAFEQPSSPVSRHFALLRKAIEENRRTRIDYFSLGRNETSQRVVRPYFLTKSLGFWYLTAYCELRKSVRTFKFERILSVELLKGVFQPPRDSDFEEHKRNFLARAGEKRVEILFDREVAPWIREQWGNSVREAKHGKVVLTLLGESLEFPSRLVLSYAPHAKPLAPEELIEKVRKDANEIVGYYKRTEKKAGPRRSAKTTRKSTLEGKKC